MILRMMTMMIQMQKITFLIIISILSHVLYEGMVQAGCTDVAEMCIWDTDKVVNVCQPFYAGGETDTYNVCRTSTATYKNIAFELKAYTTFGGFNPCFESGVTCPEIQSVFIRTCRARARSTPICISKNESVWRYFSYGNRIQSKDDTSGIGTIVGRPYVAGTYNITYQVILVDGECALLSTAYLQLRDSCLGDEQYVLA